MSSSSDDQFDKECPLCMEILELDDVHFYPCKCEYQICRFCWHRIRTDGNGLCPACRQPFPEDPVNFKPLSSIDIQRHHNEKKMKKQAEKVKMSETRQHLASYRVLQKNLVYVVGLSSRVADSELLKKNEYFGRYGKILKVVTSLAPNIHPHQHLPASYTAYVTYKKVEEALKAIQGVNNSYLDGRLVKASLGTTKYCSSFLQSRKCFKPECMYLHEIAEPEISFTKEDMHAGKHTDFEKRLSETLLNQVGPPTQTVANIIEKSISLGTNSQKSTVKLMSQWDDADGDNELDANDDELENSDRANRNATFDNDLADNSSCKSNDSTSIEDPAPSNPGDETLGSKRSNASARERQWSERDEISVAQSHSPPTDPEANENEIDLEDAENRLDGMMSELGIADRSSTEFSFLGVPALAEHSEAPAPLINWQTLLGLSPQQPLVAPTVNTETLFSSFTQSFHGIVPQQADTIKRTVPTPPPGLSRYGSDDELGFDPFTESAKGLSALLQEEEDELPQSSLHHMSMPPQQNSLSLLMLQQQQQQQQQQNHQQQSQQHHQLQSQQHLQQQSQQQQHHQQLQQSSLLHQLHQHQQQQQMQQQQIHGFGQTSSLASLWSTPTQSLFSNQMNSINQIQQQQQQQHQQQHQIAALQSTLMQDPFTSTFSSLHMLRQQQMAAAQAQQQQQQQQASAAAAQQGSFYQEMAAARQAAAAASTIFSQMQQQQQQQQIDAHHSQFTVAPPPGLSVPPSSRPPVSTASAACNQQPLHLQQSHQMSQMSQINGQHWTQQSSQLSQTNSNPQHQHQSQQLPSLSMQETFKALLPNVNVRFMDDSAMSRWSHENSLRSNAVPPPPGFSSVLNR